MGLASQCDDASMGTRIPETMDLARAQLRRQLCQWHPTDTYVANFPIHFQANSSIFSFCVPSGPFRWILVIDLTKEYSSPETPNYFITTKLEHYEINQLLMQITPLVS